MSVRPRRGGGEVPDVSEMDPWKDDRCRDFIALNTIQRLRAYHLPRAAPMPDVEAVNAVRARNLLLLPRARPDYRPCLGEVASSTNNRTHTTEQDKSTAAEDDIQQEQLSTSGCCAIEQARVLYFGPASFVSSVSPRQLVNSPHYASPSATPSQVVTLGSTPARPSAPPASLDTCLRLCETSTQRNTAGNDIADSPSPMHAPAPMPHQTTSSHNNNNNEEDDHTPDGRVVQPRQTQTQGHATADGPVEGELASRVLDFGTPLRVLKRKDEGDVKEEGDAGQAHTPAHKAATSTTAVLDACRFSCEVTDTLIAYFQSLLTRGVVLDRFSHKDLAFAWWVIGCEMHIAALANPTLGRREGLLIRLRNYYYSLLSSRKRRGTAPATRSEGEDEESEKEDDEEEGQPPPAEKATTDEQQEEGEGQDKAGQREEGATSEARSSSEASSIDLQRATSDKGKQRTTHTVHSAAASEHEEGEGEEEEEEEEENEETSKKAHTPPVTQRMRGRGRGGRGAATVGGARPVQRVAKQAGKAEASEEEEEEDEGEEREADKSTASGVAAVAMPTRGRGRGAITAAAAAAATTGRGRGGGAAATTAMWHSARISRRHQAAIEAANKKKEAEEEEEGEDQDDESSSKTQHASHAATRQSGAKVSATTAQTSLQGARRGRGGGRQQTSTNGHSSTPSMPEEQTIAEMISHIEAHEAATRAAASSAQLSHKRRRQRLSEEAEARVASASSSATVSPVAKRSPAFPGTGSNGSTAHHAGEGKANAMQAASAAVLRPPVVLRPSRLLRHATRRLARRMSDMCDEFTPLASHCYRTIMTDAFGAESDSESPKEEDAADARSLSSPPATTTAKMMMLSMLRHDQRVCEDMMRRTRHGVLLQNVSQDDDDNSDESRQASKEDEDMAEEERQQYSLHAEDKGDAVVHDDTHAGDEKDDAVRAKLSTPFAALPFAQQCLLVWEANSLLEAYDARKTAAEARWLRRQARPGMATRRMASQAVQSMPLEAWSDAEDFVLSESGSSGTASEESSSSSSSDESNYEEAEDTRRAVKQEEEAKTQSCASNHGYRAFFDYWADARATLKTDDVHNFFAEPEYHVLIIGHEASGKTTLLEQLKYMYSEEAKSQQQQQQQEDEGSDAIALSSNNAGTNGKLSQQQMQDGRCDGDDEEDDEEDSFRSLRSAMPWAVPPTNHRSTSSALRKDGRNVHNRYAMHDTSQEASHTMQSGASHDKASREILPLPPDTPLPASAAHMRRKHIRPTVGMNLASLTHRFAPLVLHVAPPQALRSLPVGLPSPSVAAMTPQHVYSRGMNNDGTRVATARHPAASSASASSSSSLLLTAAEESLERQRRLTTAVRSERTRLQLWDLGGQLSLRALWSTYFPQCQAVIFVLDSTLPFAMTTAATSGETEGKAHRAGGRDGVAAVHNTHTSGTSSNGLSLPAFGASSTSTTTTTTTTLQESASGNNNNDKSSGTHAFTATTVDALTIRQALRGNRATLQRLLLHPQLQGVPFLVLSNKIDQEPHLSLAEVQEGLGMASLAARQAFYAMHGTSPDLSTTTTTRGNDGASQHYHNNNNNNNSSHTNGVSQTELPDSHMDNGIAPGESRGGSGFGNVVWKLAEISALDGAGVAPAMDWLVTQLLRRARTVDVDSTN